LPQREEALVEEASMVGAASTEEAFTVAAFGAPVSGLD
jgi:hypothetical protein